MNISETQARTITERLAGKYTFVIIGPSQHGKTTFLSRVIGVQDKLEIGDGTGSATQSMNIYFQKSLITGVEVQFIDSPGLNDSHTTERSNEAIKNKIRTYLTNHKPHCVMLFYKFPAELTASFKESVLFAKEIATKYKCPVMLTHTCCDGAAALSTYPGKFVADVDDGEEENLLVQKCFLKWKEVREQKVSELLGESILFFKCCYGFKRKGLLTLPDGTEAVENVMNTLRNAIGNSLLLIVAEFAKDQEARRWSEILLTAGAAFMVMLGLLLSRK